MPLGLISGGPFSPFSRAISRRKSEIARSCSASFTNNLTTSSRSWVEDRSSRLSGALTHSLNRNYSRRCKQKSGLALGFAGITEKFPKLQGWKTNYGARSILVLEDSDFSFTNEAS